MGKQERIAAGVTGLLGFIVAAAVAPDFAGAVLMLFSFLVFVFAVVGLIWPGLVRLPNRLAAVWVFALSFGMFVGGGMLLAPPNGESTASDQPSTVYLEHLSPEDRRVHEEALETGETVPSPSLAARLLDIEGMTHCNIRLQDAARVLYSDGALYRWTTTELEERFGQMESSNLDVTTYFGSAIEFMNPDGTWIRTFYQCDWNHETGEIIDVRTRPGR